MSEEYEIVQYGVGSIYLEEGWYSYEYLKEMIELNEKRSKELIKDMQKTLENTDD